MIGVVAWLTGLPASGKTTIASLAAEMLRRRELRVEVLDGDWVRQHINTDVGFSREDRERHLLRSAWIARLLARNGVVVLAAFVSPYRDVRAKVRRIIEEEAKFIEVYVKASLEDVIRRDPKGLYKRALRGEIKGFTGVDDPYEEPEAPDLVLDTSRLTPEEAAERLVEAVLAASNKNGIPQFFMPCIEIPDGLLKRLEKAAKDAGYDDVAKYLSMLLEELLVVKSDEDEITKRLRDLGYV